MNGAFWHLLINHIPVMGFPFALMLFVVAFARKSAEIALVSYAALVFLALATYAVDRTGGPAAHQVRPIPGVSVEMIRPHAHAGGRAVLGSELLGVMGLIGLFVFKRSRTWMGLSAVGALALSAQLAWVAHLGGLIRHPEAHYGGMIAIPSQSVIPKDMPRPDVD